MPRYTIEDPQTGKRVTIEGDAPPTQEQAAAIFAQLGQTSAPVVPAAPPSSELVAGDSDERRAANARNLQRKLGLVDPIEPGGTLSYGARSIASAAPTESDREAFYKQRFGEANVRKLGEVGGRGRYLLRQADRDGNAKWVVDDPVGFDFGDITADAVGSAPEIASGMAAAAKVVPGPQAGLLRIAGASGLAAGVEQGVGALRDAAFRASNDMPIRPGEIAARRAPAAGLQTILGVPLAQMGAMFARRAGIGAPGLAEDLTKRFAGEADIAANRLAQMGVDAPLTAGERSGVRFVQEQERSAEVLGRLAGVGRDVRSRQQQVGEAVRKLDPRAVGADRAATRMLISLNRVDDAMALRSQEAFLQAAQQTEGGVLGQLARLGPAAPDITTAGGHVRAVAASNYDKARAAASELYAQFDTALAQAGADGKIVRLTETKSLAKELLGKLLEETKIVDVPGAPASALLDQFGRPAVAASGPGQRIARSSLDLYAPMLRELRQIAAAGDTPQSVAAARQLRSMLGEAMRSDAPFSEGLKGGTVKRLYGALSKDIDASVSAYDGPAAELLKAANRQYRNGIAPFEETPVLQRLVRTRGEGGFANDAEVINYFSQAPRLDEMKAVGSYLGPEGYARLKRAVADDLMGNATVRIGDREFADLGAAYQRLQRVPPEVKNEIFGNRKAWADIERGLNQFRDITASKELFTSKALPEPVALQDFIKTARETGVWQAQKGLREATRLAVQRRRIFTDRMLGQVRKGRYGKIQESPDKFLDEFAFSGNYSPTYVEHVMEKLPEDVRQDVASAAFQRIFDRAKVVAKSTADGLEEQGGRRTFDAIKAAEDVFGSREKTRIAKSILGDDLYGKVRTWLAYEMGVASARRNVGQIGTFSREQLTNLTQWPEAAAKAAGARIVFSDPGQSLLQQAATSQQLRARIASQIGKQFAAVARTEGGRAAGVVVPQQVAPEVYDALMNWEAATDGMTQDQKAAAYQFLFGG